MTALAKPDCKDVIGACDAALEAKNKALELSDLAITKCKENTATLQTKNNELMDSNGRWYKNPFVMFILGAASGTLTYVLVKK